MRKKNIVDKLITDNAPNDIIFVLKKYVINTMSYMISSTKLMAFDILNLSHQCIIISKYLYVFNLKKFLTSFLYTEKNIY